jgi:diguanylate cyclase (GGDEF)-like protein/PAS domain S-box-containing protein
MPPPFRHFREHRSTVELQDALTEAPAGGAFSLITALGARMFDAPMAAIGIRDERDSWTYFLHGFPDTRPGQNIAFLRATMAASEPVVVPDARLDERFAVDPLMGEDAGVQFFAGVPLPCPEDDTGGIAGVLGIFDTRPREFNAEDVDLLGDLALIAAREISLPGAPAASADHEEKAEQYRDLFENTTDIVYTHDLRGRFTAVTRAVEFITGYSREEVLGMNVTELVAPEEREATLQRILEQIGGAPSDTYELAIVTKDGRRVILEANTRLLFKRGRPVGVQGFARDITERAMELARRRAAEAQLQEKTMELAQFSEHLRQIHRLSLTDHASIDDLFADCLATGRRMFGASVGIVAEGPDGHVVVRAVEPAYDALRTGQVMDMRALDGISAPILIEGARYGTLYFGLPASRERRGGSAEETEVVELMAASIGHFLANARIETERARDAALSKDINQVLEMAGRNSPLDDILRQLAHMIERHGCGGACAILLARSGRLTLAASAGLDEELLGPLREIRIGTGGGFCGTAALTVASAAEKDLSRDAVLGACGQRYAAFGFTSGCAIPIVSATGEALGVIAGLWGGTASIERLLQTAGHLAAIAIEQRQLTDRLAYQAKHDPLTGLPNRLHLMEWLHDALASARGAKTQMAVMFIDLDRFKQINDTLGHATGDLLIQQVGLRLQRLTPPNGTVSKMGGDEFAAILNNLQDPEDAARFARQVLSELRAPYHVDEHELFITASIGICLFPKDGADVRSLLRHADIAMYRAKKQGKNDIHFFTPQNGPNAMERLAVETQLRRALENEELELYYQPIMRMDGKLDGLEVLLSWNNPKLGRIPPSQFIPIAEESGMIATIGAWVLRRACAQNARWRKAGLPPVRISVNVSALQFGRSDFIETVAGALAESELPRGLLDLELTEGLVMGDVEESLRLMSKLRDLGVTITIDDFGTG